MDYHISFTDASKTPFSIKPYTTNGPDAPASATPLHQHAVSANTSLILVGKGMIEYGELVQRNFVHLLENFANTTAPAYPVAGQLWFKSSTGELKSFSGAAWLDVPVNGKSTTPFSFNNVIVSGIATPVSPADAVPMSYVTGNYLALAGGSMSGSITLTGGGKITLPNAPAVDTDAANKQYVDDAINGAIFGNTGTYVSKAGDTMTGALTITTGDLDVQGGDVTVSGAVTTNGNLTTTNGNVVVQSGNLIVSSGAQANSLVIATTASVDSLSVASASTLTGTVACGADLSIAGNVTLGAATSYIDVNGGSIRNIAAPLQPGDAATKGYVDSAVIAAGGADGVVIGGVLNGSTGVLTLQRSASLPAITVTGTFATRVHGHAGSDVTINANGPYWDSLVREQLIYDSQFPNEPLPAVLQVLDRAAFQIMAPNLRDVQQITNSTTTVITTPFEFKVGYSKLQVYVNGLKQIADFRGLLVINTSPVLSLSANTGFTPSTTYTLLLDVDGVSYPSISVTTPSSGTYTLNSYIQDLDSALSAASIPATATYIDGSVIIASLSTGVGSSVHYVNGNLVASLAGYTSVDEIPGMMDLSYSEDGIPYTYSTQITFHSPLPNGALVELILTK
jgi:hypothetical protein